MWWKIVEPILDALCCVYMVYSAFTGTVWWRIVIDGVTAAALAVFFYDGIKDLTKKEK